MTQGMSKCGRIGQSESAKKKRKYYKLVSLHIREYFYSGGGFRVVMTRYNRKMGVPNIRIRSGRISTLAEAIKWRESHVPSAMKSGPKFTGLYTPERARMLIRDRYERLKAAHKCVDCMDLIPKKDRGHVTCLECRRIKRLKFHQRKSERVR
jgi:hypothetical protein